MADDDQNDSLAHRYRNLQTRAELREALDEERKKSDELYSKIIVERIVFGFLALIAVAVVGALLKLVVLPS